MQTYIYVWGNNEKRLTLRGRECIVLARGKMNSILIEFTDNRQREIVSRNSIRKPKPTTDCQNDTRPATLAHKA